MAFFENGKKCSTKLHLRCPCFKNGKIIYDISCSTCTPVDVVDFDHFYNGKVSKTTFGNATFSTSPAICSNMRGFLLRHVFDIPRSFNLFYNKIYANFRYGFALLTLRFRSGRNRHLYPNEVRRVRNTCTRSVLL